MESMVSIIVPIYNTQKYLEQCLNSLLTQTYRNLQIILVDDGSTDGSGKICDAYAARDNRIHVIHQKNQGVSAARNQGLEKAQGEWVVFVDSDDFLPNTSLEALVKSNVDLAIGGIRELDENGNCLETPKKLPSQVLSQRHALDMLFDESLWGYQGYVWNKSYRMQIIRQYGIRFDPSVKYNEDRLFIVEYLLHCTTISMIPQMVYFYRKWMESALGQIDVSFKPAMLTELDAFERMKRLTQIDYPEVFQRISWLSFEKALYWLRRIPPNYAVEKKHVRRILHDNARICLKCSKNVFRKVKIIGHCILER